MTHMRTAAQRQREKIQSGMIIRRLSDHVQGKCEMSSTQIQAARILLNKTMPDIKALEIAHTGNINLATTRRLSDEELMAIAAGGLDDKAAPVIEGEVEAVEEPLKLVAE